MGLFSGLFGSKKTVTVASSTYNLAGDPTDRKSYLRSTAMRAILSNSGASVGETVLSGQLNGPHFEQRKFFRWAQNNYPEGELTGSLTSMQEMTTTEHLTIADEIDNAINQKVSVIEAGIDFADISYWAERYIYDNHRDRIDTEWRVDWLEVSQQMQITWVDTTTTLVTLTDFDPSKDYLYAYYINASDDTLGDWAYGTRVNGDQNRPDTTTPPAWTRTNHSQQTHPYFRETTVVTNERATIQDPWVNVGNTYNEVEQSITVDEETWSRTVYVNQVGTIENYQKERLHIWGDYELWDDVNTVEVFDYDRQVYVQTITTVRDARHLYDHQLDTQTLTQENFPETKNLFIYAIGSGTVELDALQKDSGNISEFFPIIPLRRYNAPITHPNYSTHYPNVKRAYERATGNSITTLLDEIDSNPDIGQIDHCFMVFGVEINNSDNAAQRYIYEFLKSLNASEGSVSSDLLNDLETWENNAASHEAFQDQYNEWLVDRNENPGEAGDPPVWVPASIPSHRKIRLRADSGNGVFNLPYDVEIQWRIIAETEGVGKGKPDAERGDLWWATQPNVTGTGEAPLVISHIRLYHQHSDDAFSFLDVYGLQHINRVYDGKTVVTGAAAGVNDTDDSTFVFPLHYPTLKSMPIIAANELSSLNRVLVFNSYEVTKIKWWQRGIFKAIFGIIMIVVSVVFFPAAGLSVGLLGSNIAVGTALGLSGTTAIIAGAVVNALAAVVLTSAIEVGATAVFGEELGTILAVVATLVLTAGISAYQNTGSFAVNYSELMRGDNLLKLTDSLAGGVRKILQAKVAGVQAEMEDLNELFEEKNEQLQDLWEQLGGSEVFLDPLMWTEMSESIGDFTPESSDAFIRRTLLTGPELAEMSHAMISSFTELSLTLPDPIQ